MARVIVRLYHADRTVRQDLRQALESRPGIVLATQVQGPRNLRIDDRTPFKEILESAGSFLDLIVLIDEGKPEGMWRDPFGELCDRLYSDRKEAAAATSSYVLLRAGQPLAYFRKALWDPFEDAEAITAYLARTVAGVKAFERPKVKAPEPPKGPAKPKPKKTPIINPAVGAMPACETIPEMPSVVISADFFDDAPKDATAVTEIPSFAVEPEPPPPPPPPPPEPPPLDPYPVLGLHRGVSFEEAKKTYRALIIQYHPDKVSHLAPEFRVLAEKMTRDLNEAFALIEKDLGR